MRTLTFPIHFTFNISTIANDCTATDAYGNTVAYVKQKLFKFKGEMVVYADKNRGDVLFIIRADRWIDFSAAYSFTDAGGTELGKVARKGWASIFKAEYELIDQHQKLQYHIREENAWIKVLDGLFSEIPVLGILTGYVFNPAYIVSDLQEQPVVRIKKQPSFWGRRFEITKLREFDQDDAERIMLGLMMMVLLERRRG